MMHFTISFLAVVLLLSSWNGNQVSGYRSIRLKVHSFAMDLTFYGLEIVAHRHIYENEYKHLFPIVRRMKIHKDLLGNNIHQEEHPKVLLGYSTTCIGKFCVIVVNDPWESPVLYMSHSFPLADGPGDWQAVHQVDVGTTQIIALEVPQKKDTLYPDFHCRKRRDCLARIAAYGVETLTFEIPYHRFFYIAVIAFIRLA